MHGLVPNSNIHVIDLYNYIIGSKAAQFHLWEYLNRILFTVWNKDKKRRKPCFFAILGIGSSPNPYTSKNRRREVREVTTIAGLADRGRGAGWSQFQRHFNNVVFFTIIAPWPCNSV